VTDDVEGMRKEASAAYMRHCLGICVNGLRNIQNTTEICFFIIDAFWDFVLCSSSSNRRFTLRILKMEAIYSPKRRFELELHGAKSQKASLIDTAVEASQKVVFFDHSEKCFCSRQLSR
jgi:hypothetical protein